MTKKGSLLVVGSGIKAGGHLTPEAQSAIKNADKVFYAEGNYPIVYQIKSLNPNAETLSDLYAKDKARYITYWQMVERIITAVRAGQDVCAVFYGHPGVFAFPSHQSINIARAEGFEALMLPGISAEDCLFADLGIDPGIYGCQSYEATDFLIYRRVFDRRSTLVLWQVGGIGKTDYQGKIYEGLEKGVALLVETLLESYPAEHEAVIYEAAQVALFLPRMKRVHICKLGESVLTAISTLVIFPDPNWSEPDMERVRQLGIENYEEIRKLRKREFQSIPDLNLLG
ncbi:SAM-dependent methyltransferase [Kamptonema formosum]|uniref:SAM-dependent methyltransferase n=1 Tax=Kamptonema formosum TaxID=331992 RepID=UPI000348A2E5|nr:SAM-dependent methyltransferase [Oscillatoria sp. PCC 10802]